MWYHSLISKSLAIDPAISKQIESFCIDSRLVTKNSLFFALPGEKVDGHQFLEQALKKGAIAAVVEKGRSNKKVPLLYIEVEDVKVTLQNLAHQLIQLWKPQIIGITGSLGKTSTKDFLYDLLSEKLDIMVTPKNYNTQLTLPLTILNSTKPVNYLILEMGLHKKGEIGNLLRIAPPTYGILTMIAHVHVGFFDSFESLANEKLKIIEASKEMALYNLDMPFSEKVMQRGKCQKFSYSLKDKKANFYLEKQGPEISFYRDQLFLFKCPSPFFDYKSHYNLLAAVSMALLLKIDHLEVKDKINALKHRENRLQIVRKKEVTFLSDAYNSNVDSAENALIALSENFPGRKIVVLSEMVHQGKYNKENHEKLTHLGLKYADIVIGYGEQMEHMRKICKKSKKKWAFFYSYPNMLAYISKLIQKRDTILLKGSRSFRLERLLHDITFD